MFYGSLNHGWGILLTLNIKKWGNLLTLNPKKLGNAFDPELGNTFDPMRFLVGNNYDPRHLVDID